MLTVPMPARRCLAPLLAAAHLLISATMLLSTANAQSLIAECARIEDSTRRVECFEAVAKSGQVASSSPDRMGTLIRAGQVMVGAVNGGITYVLLGDRIVSFSSEIAVARNDATSQAERDAVEKYEHALQIYSDSRRLWDADIRYNSRNMIRMPLLVVLVPDIVSKYELPTVAGDLLGITRGVDAATGIRQLWSRAEEQIRQGTELLKPTPTRPTPEPVAEASAKSDRRELAVSFTTIETNLRAEPMINATITEVLKQGTTVDILEVGEYWSLIRVRQSTEGWVATPALHLWKGISAIARP